MKKLLSWLSVLALTTSAVSTVSACSGWGCSTTKSTPSDNGGNKKPDDNGGNDDNGGDEPHKEDDTIVMPKEIALTPQGKSFVGGVKVTLGKDIKKDGWHQRDEEKGLDLSYNSKSGEIEFKLTPNEKQTNAKFVSFAQTITNTFSEDLKFQTTSGNTVKKSIDVSVPVELKDATYWIDFTNQVVNMNYLNRSSIIKIHMSNDVDEKSVITSFDSKGIFKLTWLNIDNPTLEPDGTKTVGAKIEVVPNYIGSEFPFTEKVSTNISFSFKQENTDKAAVIADHTPSFITANVLPANRTVAWKQASDQEVDNNNEVKWTIDETMSSSDIDWTSGPVIKSKSWDDDWIKKNVVWDKNTKSLTIKFEDGVRRDAYVFDVLFNLVKGADTNYLFANDEILIANKVQPTTKEQTVEFDKANVSIKGSAATWSIKNIGEDIDKEHIGDVLVDGKKVAEQDITWDGKSLSVNISGTKAGNHDVVANFKWTNGFNGSTTVKLNAIKEDALTVAWFSTEQDFGMGTFVSYGVDLEKSGKEIDFSQQPEVTCGGLDKSDYDYRYLDGSLNIILNNEVKAGTYEFNVNFYSFDGGIANTSVLTAIKEQPMFGEASISWINNEATFNEHTVSYDMDYIGSDVDLNTLEVKAYGPEDITGHFSKELKNKKLIITLDNEIQSGVYNFVISYDLKNGYGNKDHKLSAPILAANKENPFKAGTSLSFISNTANFKEDEVIFTADVIGVDVDTDKDPIVDSTKLDNSDYKCNWDKNTKTLTIVLNHEINKDDYDFEVSFNLKNGYKGQSDVARLTAQKINPLKSETEVKFEQTSVDFIENKAKFQLDMNNVGKDVDLTNLNFKSLTNVALNHEWDSQTGLLTITLDDEISKQDLSFNVNFNLKNGYKGTSNTVKLTANKVNPFASEREVDINKDATYDKSINGFAYSINKIGKDVDINKFNIASDLVKGTDYQTEVKDSQLVITLLKEIHGGDHNFKVSFDLTNGYSGTTDTYELVAHKTLATDTNVEWITNNQDNTVTFNPDGVVTFALDTSKTGVDVDIQKGPAFVKSLSNTLPDSWFTYEWNKETKEVTIKLKDGYDLPGQTGDSIKLDIEFNLTNGYEGTTTGNKPIVVEKMSPNPKYTSPIWEETTKDLLDQDSVTFRLKNYKDLIDLNMGDIQVASADENISNDMFTKAWDGINLTINISEKADLKPGEYTFSVWFKYGNGYVGDDGLSTLTVTKTYADKYQSKIQAVGDTQNINVDENYFEMPVTLGSEVSTTNYAVEFTDVEYKPLDIKNYTSKYENGKLWFKFADGTFTKPMTVHIYVTFGLENGLKWIKEPYKLALTINKQHASASETSIVFGEPLTFGGNYNPDTIVWKLKSRGALADIFVMQPKKITFDDIDNKDVPNDAYWSWDSSTGTLKLHRDLYAWGWMGGGLSWLTNKKHKITITFSVIGFPNDTASVDIYSK